MRDGIDGFVFQRVCGGLEINCNPLASGAGDVNVSGVGNDSFAGGGRVFRGALAVAVALVTGFGGAPLA